MTSRKISDSFPLDSNALLRKSDPFCVQISKKLLLTVVPVFQLVSREAQMPI